MAGAVLTQPTPGPAASVPGQLAAELQQQQVEAETAPTTDLLELGANVRAWRRAADERARSLGARVAALATSPLPVVPRLTPDSRYRAMTERLGLTAVEQRTCGCHVHVGVADDDEGVAVLDRIRVWLPVLLASRPNSPFWQGTRHRLRQLPVPGLGPGVPTAGPTETRHPVRPPAAGGQALVDSGGAAGRGHDLLDARLSHKYPTVEIRVADVCLYAPRTPSSSPGWPGRWSRPRPGTRPRAGPLRPGVPPTWSDWPAGGPGSRPWTASCWIRTNRGPDRQPRFSGSWLIIFGRCCTTPGTKGTGGRGPRPGPGPRGGCIHPAPARRTQPGSRRAHPDGCGDHPRPQQVTSCRGSAAGERR